MTIQTRRRWWSSWLQWPDERSSAWTVGSTARLFRFVFFSGDSVNYVNFFNSCTRNTMEWNRRAEPSRRPAKIIPSCSWAWLLHTSPQTANVPALSECRWASHNESFHCYYLARTEIFSLFYSSPRLSQSGNFEDCSPPAVQYYRLGSQEAFDPR